MTLCHRPRYHNIQLIEDCYSIVIYIWGGLKNNTLKDIILLYILWFIEWMKNISIEELKNSLTNKKGGSIYTEKKTFIVLLLPP